MTDQEYYEAEGRLLEEIFQELDTLTEALKRLTGGEPIESGDHPSLPESS